MTMAATIHTGTWDTPEYVAGMSLPNLEPTTRVADRAFDAIQDAILRGDLPAGQRLRFRQLAEELNVSVTPVREAIQRLEEIGLVETAPHKGVAVKSFVPQELLYQYDVRRLLEVQAVGEGVRKISATDVKRLHKMHRLMATDIAENRLLSYVDRDEEFLTVLYSAANNPVLVEMIVILWRRCRSYKIVGARREIETGVASVHQGQLLEAIADADPELAQRITAESLDAAISRIRSSFGDSAK
jgi:DNA-binding GntR family transcriptional regulator